jgi:hypothetical protein
MSLGCPQVSLKRLMPWILGTASIMFGATGCSLGPGQDVPMFAALKPPESYALHIAAWDGLHLQERTSSLLHPDNPVQHTLADLYAGQTVWHIGALLPEPGVCVLRQCAVHSLADGLHHVPCQPQLHHDKQVHQMTFCVARCNTHATTMS